MSRPSRPLGKAAILALLVLGNLLFLALPRADYDAIVVHHSAGRSGDFRDIRRAHRARGWFEIAYHFVLSNGSTKIGAGHLEATLRYRLGLWSTATTDWRCNLSALHLCVVGNYETEALPTALEAALGHAVGSLQQRFEIPDGQIFLHRDCNPTACPGKNITRPQLVAWAAAGGGSAELRRQHREAIESPILTPLSYGTAWALLNLLSLFALLRKPLGPPADSSGGRGCRARSETWRAPRAGQTRPTVSVQGPADAKDR